MADQTPNQTPNQPTPVRLLEGERVLVQVTVNENVKEGQVLKEGKFEIHTRPDGGERFISQTLVYPFPAGLIDDPVTGKPHADLTPTQLAKAIENWAKAVEAVKLAGGRIVTKDLEGADIEGVVPIQPIPTNAEIFLKGFKLEIQGPVNQQMRKDQLVVKGKSATVTKVGKNFSKIGG